MMTMSTGHQWVGRTSTHRITHALDDVSVFGRLQHGVHPLHGFTMSDSTRPRVVMAGVPTRMDKRRAGVERHHVLVHRDVRLAKGLLGELSCDALVREVDEHEGGCRPATDKVVAAFHKRTCHAS